MGPGFARALTLALLSAVLSASPQLVEGRARPLYREVLDLSRQLARNDQHAQASAELARRVARWEERGFGLQADRDADMALASATALVLLLPDSNRSEQLFLLLAEIRELPEAVLDPDLALALAQGWLGLSSVSAFEALPLEERREHLATAVQAAETLDRSDQRDAFGARLTHELYRLLPRPGPESRAVVERGLERFAEDREARPYLLAALADEHRAAGQWTDAWSALAAAEELLDARRSGQEPADLAVLERTLAGVRCQFELAWGLMDRAALSLQRERAAVAAGASDAASFVDLLLNASGLALAVTRSGLLRSTLAELEAGLATHSLAGWPAARAQLQARRALMLEMLAEAEVEPRAAAREALAAAWQDPALDEVHRLTVGVRLVLEALEGGEPEAAEGTLAELESRAKGAASSELRGTVAALRARQALAQAAGDEVLIRLRAGLEEHFRSFLASFEERPERTGGLGYLAWRNRRLLIGTLFELGLELEGTVDLVLREQLLGSLAQRLGCGAATLARARTELLAPGMGLLLYLPGWDSTHLVVLEGQSLEHFEIPWKYEAEEAPEVLLRTLSDSPASRTASERQRGLSTFDRAAAELAGRLIPAPLATRMQAWRGAYVVGADRLGPIAFEALPLAGVALGTRLALAQLPSLPVGLELAARERREPREFALDCLLVAAPTVPRETQARFQLAVLDPDEMGGLAKPFRRVKALLGENARWSEIREVLERQPPRLLQFVVHGVNDPLRELSGGLGLASSPEDQDGVLWCEELHERSFQSPPIVALVACGSARGPRRIGDDGLSQIGGTFIVRGASCVVQAVGDLALAPTVELLESFGDALAHDASPAEALRRARAELAAKAEFAHPFYTSSLRLVGIGLGLPPRR